MSRAEPGTAGGRFRRRYVLGVGLLPVWALALALGLAASRPGCTYGCSRMEDTMPTGVGCLPKAGSACYECYEAGPAGFRTCFENPEGTYSICTEYQQVPF